MIEVALHMVAGFGVAILALALFGIHRTRQQRRELTEMVKLYRRTFPHKCLACESGVDEVPEVGHKHTCGWSASKMTAAGLSDTNQMRFKQ